MPLLISLLHQICHMLAKELVCLDLIGFKAKALLKLELMSMFLSMLY